MLNVCSRLVSVNMSKVRISDYFQTSVGEKKRKRDLEETYDSPDSLKKNVKVLAEDSEDISASRNYIIELSKKNPALSANIGLTWFKALSKEFSEEYFKELGEFLRVERRKYTIYPPEKEVYLWTNTVKIHDVKVIILGQDPYHGPNQAHGLAFSVRQGVLCPPSLQNIYKELSTDIPEFNIPKHGFLYGWALQGVLLLNASLTVRSGNPDSHKDKWSRFTDAVITWINDNLPNSVFILWGKKAEQKLSLITKNKHLVLTAPHPSPFSARTGFFGCHHFSKANEYLEKHNKKPINWNYLPVSKPA